MNINKANRMKPGDTIEIKKTKERKKIKKVILVNYNNLKFECEDGSQYNHIQVNPVKAAGTYKKDSAVNCCPACGGVVNIVADIPYRIILDNREGEALIAQGYRDEDLFKIMHDAISNKTAYECYCDDCDAELYATPRPNKPKEYIISLKKEERYKTAKDIDLYHIAEDADKLEINKADETKRKTDVYAIIHDNKENVDVVLVEIEKTNIDEKKEHFIIYTYVLNQKEYNEKKRIEYSVETEATSRKSKRELRNKLKEIRELYTGELNNK